MSARLRTLTVVLMLCAVAACGGDTPASPFLVAEADLAAAEASFAPIGAEEDAFAALVASGDTGEEAIRAFVGSVYSPDVVFHDATFGDHSEGYDQATSMYRTFLLYFADAASEHRPPLIGDETALQVIPFWDMTLGSFRFTSEAPLTEVDLIEVDGGRISSLLLFYDLASLRRMYGDLPHLDGALQDRYAEAWASGSAARVAELYADGAVRHDRLGGGSAAGPEAISGVANGWFEALPGATWGVQLGFAERYGEQAGGVFEVSDDGCTVVVGVLWDIDADGMITTERVHYDPAALRACGWVD